MTIQNRLYQSQIQGLNEQDDTPYGDWPDDAHLGPWFLLILAAFAAGMSAAAIAVLFGIPIAIVYGVLNHNPDGGVGGPQGPPPGDPRFLPSTPPSWQPGNPGGPNLPAS